jgi:hypothetical protein
MFIESSYEFSNGDALCEIATHIMKHNNCDEYFYSWKYVDENCDDHLLINIYDCCSFHPYHNLLIFNMSHIDITPFNKVNNKLDFTNMFNLFTHIYIDRIYIDAICKIKQKVCNIPKISNEKNKTYDMNNSNYQSQYQSNTFYDNIIPQSSMFSTQQYHLGDYNCHVENNIVTDDVTFEVLKRRDALKYKLSVRRGLNYINC